MTRHVFRDPRDIVVGDVVSQPDVTDGGLWKWMRVDAIEAVDYDAIGAVRWHLSNGATKIARFGVPFSVRVDDAS